MKTHASLALAIFATLAATGLRAQTPAKGVDKLYILNCGEGHSGDEARWSPGVNVGVPRDVSDNCYLIHHASGWFLWDTGIVDSIADKPEGSGDPATILWKRPKKLSTQLAELGVKPDGGFTAFNIFHDVMKNRVGGASDLYSIASLMSVAMANFKTRISQGDFK